MKKKRGMAHKKTTGALNGNAKFTPEQIRLIRNLYDALNLEKKYLKRKKVIQEIVDQISTKTKVSYGCIWRIVTKNRKWRTYQNVK